MTGKLASASNLTMAAAFTLGCFAATVVSQLTLKWKLRKFRALAGASEEGEDHSFFYDDDIEALTTVKDNHKVLPPEFYGQMVRGCVICCVDCVIVRNRIDEHGKKKNLRECLLVERSNEPAQGLWWLPGGRICKGETFFTAAKRKCIQETGVDGDPIQILGVYNTFFPASSWDKDDAKGTQTVNVVVLIEVNDSGSKVTLDETSKRFRWLPMGIDDDQLNEEDQYVSIQLKRIHGWNATFRK